MSEVFVPENIAELIECFRPGIDDLSSPEFQALGEWMRQDPSHARLVESIQDMDAEIAHSFVQVAAPIGLAEKIKNGLPGLSASDGPALPVQQPVTLNPTSSWMSKPSILTGATAGMVVAIVILASLLLSPTTPLATDSQVDAKGALGEQSIRLSEEIAKEVGEQDKWQYDTTLAPADYGLDNQLDFKIRAWQPAPNMHDENAVVYRVAVEDDEFYMFAFRSVVGQQNFSSTPTQEPDSEMNGWCASAYQSGELVYVMAVNGPSAKYREILKKAIQTTVD